MADALPPPASPPSGGLDTPTLVGIAVGAGGGAGVLCLCIVYVMCKCKRSSRDSARSSWIPPPVPQAHSHSSDAIPMDVLEEGVRPLQPPPPPPAEGSPDAGAAAPPADEARSGRRSSLQKMRDVVGCFVGRRSSCPSEGRSSDSKASRATSDRSEDEGVRGAGRRLRTRQLVRSHPLARATSRMTAATATQMWP